MRTRDTKYFNLQNSIKNLKEERDELSEEFFQELDNQISSINKKIEVMENYMK